MCTPPYASIEDGKDRCKPPQIRDPRVRFRDADFGAPEGGQLFGWYRQCKIKENGLKIEGVTYKDTRFGPLQGVSYLDTGTLQDAGHL